MQAGSTTPPMLVSSPTSQQYLIVILSLLFLVFSPSTSISQNISGVINTYTSVSNINASVLTVATSAGFAAGDKVTVIQMKGVSIDNTNSAAYGDILAYNNTGNYEFATVASVTPTTITLTNSLCQNYSIAGLVQLIRVPVYSNPVVSALLTCSPWNGSTGGVLVFETSGTLTMNADIDVSGNGFRGMPSCYGSFGCNNTNYFMPSGGCQGGQKGEAVADWIFNQEGGRGKIANGGGGGNNGNSGGGGGGNFSSGGLGGFEYSGCGATGIQGLSGIGLTYTNGKIFSGGGGGTGYADNFQPISPGSNAGGIVIITAANITGNNFNIIANGNNVVGLTNDESAGGGGAGGTIFLNVPTYTGNVNVTANGGDGGSTFNNIFTSDCHGPGGGGAGGILLSPLAILPTNINFTSTGGANGLVLNPSSACYNTAYGAAPGNAGGVQLNYFAPLPIAPVSLGNDTALCSGSSLTLDAGIGYVNYLWNDGSITQTHLVVGSDTAIVVVDNGAGCTATDTVFIAPLLAIPLNIGNDVSTCEGDSISLDAGAGYTSYFWNDGSTAQTFTATDTGFFSVQITNASGCSGADTMHYTYYNVAPADLGNDTSTCPNVNLAFNPGLSYSSYLWSDGSTAQYFLADQTGNYSVTVTDANGCTSSDSVSLVSIYPLPPSMNIADTFICMGEPITLTGPDGNYSYVWNNMTVGKTYTINYPGKYSLTIYNEFLCPATDSFLVIEDCLVNLYVPNAFSPNGDGVNDLLRWFSYHVDEIHFRLYNRWGQMIFETNLMNDFWDGTLDDLPCSVGVYIWNASFTGSYHGQTTHGEMKGNVTLLR